MRLDASHMASPIGLRVQFYGVHGVLTFTPVYDLVGNACLPLSLVSFVCLSVCLLVARLRNARATRRSNDPSGSSSENSAFIDEKSNAACWILSLFFFFFYYTLVEDSMVESM